MSSLHLLGLGIASTSPCSYAEGSKTVYSGCSKDYSSANKDFIPSHLYSLARTRLWECMAMLS